jgi:hypothetical protein
MHGEERLGIQGRDKNESGRVNRNLLTPPGAWRATSADAAALPAAWLSCGRWVKPSPLQFTEEAFACQLLLGNFERFLDVVVENFDFHRCPNSRLERSAPNQVIGA